jgi:hypothetical protein
MELLCAVLEEIDKKRDRYNPELPGMFVDEVFRRCRNRRSGS